MDFEVVGGTEVPVGWVVVAVVVKVTCDTLRPLCARQHRFVDPPSRCLMMTILVTVSLLSYRPYP